MSFRERLASSVAILAAAALMTLPGCSSDPPRDIRWGTDADVDFIPPDSGITLDATVEESGNSVDSTNVEVSNDGSHSEAVSDLDTAIDGAN
jgi:hypothetical protein